MNNDYTLSLLFIVYITSDTDVNFDLDFCIKHTEYFGLNFLKELY